MRICFAMALLIVAMVAHAKSRSWIQGALTRSPRFGKTSVSTMTSSRKTT